MKNRIACVAVLAGVLSGTSLAAAPQPVNVPELMRCEDGSPVTTVAEWESKRRGEIMEFFTREEYGRRPVGRPDGLRFEAVGPDAVMMGGAAIRKRVRASWRGPRGEGTFVFTAFIPKAAADAGVRSPAFLLVCNRTPDDNLDPTRVKKSFFWPAEEIVDRGYAALAFYTSDLAPDDRCPVFTNGVYALYGDRGRDTWGALSAWAWGASRVMDWIETEPTLDAAHVAVVGHSRGGKTALVVGVTDRRFAMACSNDSGCSGAKLNHIDLPKSESVKIITGMFRHWFSLEYDKWAGRECEMPYDQHEWIALMAPRLVAVASATKDDWAGQLGEFHAARLASPAWELYGKKGLVAPAEPPTVGDRPADGLVYQEGCVSYHIRPGVHTLSAYDWHRYMDFADRHGWRVADSEANGILSDSSKLPKEWRERLRLIPSTLDGKLQPCYFWAPEAAKTQAVPLIVGLHTWSYDYRQLDPYVTVFEEAKRRGWAFVGPNFRGANKRPPACGGDPAVQDIVDAVDYAKRTVKIDASRVYITGGSGGGHMTLLMLGRHPEVFAAGAAFCPITDLARWHADSLLDHPGRGREYAQMLEGACGGSPAEKPEEYRHRSPLTHLAGARAAGVPTYVATGIHDGWRGSVPVGHSFRAFNALAAEKDRVSEADIAAVERDRRIPASLVGEDVSDPFYSEKMHIHFRRTSGNVRLTIFEGGHAGNFAAGFDFLSRQAKGRSVDWSLPAKGAGAEEKLTR